jgi:hypothetical protein
MNVRQVLPPDAIPSVDDPEFQPVGEYDGDAGDEVVAVDGDTPRAYPVRYLHYHEIVNADRDGDPIAVTWCPLCGSAVVYDRTVDGRVLEFGVSGKLADDDLVMYDRQTESEWKQSLGEAIAGPLEDTSLTVLPAAMTTVERYRDANPDGEVLAPPGGASEAASEGDDPAAIDYDEAPYEAYFEMDGFGLDAHRGGDSREWHRDDLDPKAVVLGLELDGDALGVPLPWVEAAGGVVAATVGGTDVVVCATGDGIHAYEHPGGDVAAGEGDGFHVDGTTWDGATGAGADGRTLDRLPARRLFAFAWVDDHGDDALLAR